MDTYSAATTLMRTLPSYVDAAGDGVAETRRNVELPSSRGRRLPRSELAKHQSADLASSLTDIAAQARDAFGWTPWQAAAGCEPRADQDERQTGRRSDSGAFAED